MQKIVMATVAALVFGSAGPALAQLKGPEKSPATKIEEVPKGVFYAGLGPTQYLAKTRLIGQPVLDKSGAKVAVVDDIILGTKDDKVDGLIIDVGGKKYGVRITAAKIETKDGKTTVTLPLVTAEMFKSTMPTFGAKPAAK